MVPSLLVILFVLAMAWMWAHQGLFSALIHLVLTILAGTLAFAFWEPIVYGFLINRLPEQAWGFGLVVPFGLCLLGLRTVFDKVVKGNLYFHNIIDKVGGGLLGFASGVLTAGLLWIGIQMVGMPSVANYQAYAFDDASGEVVRNQKLLIPADDIASGFFTMLSGGSMSPILGNNTLPRLHPNLAREASFYHQSAFWTDGLESSYRALPPQFVKPAANTPLSILSDVPPSIAAKGVAKDPSKQIVIVGVDVTLQSVANDSGGGFRATRNQVSLATEDASGEVKRYYPEGWIWDGHYLPMKLKGEYAWSGASANVTYHWVFQVPSGEKPQYLTLKQTRIELPSEEMNNEVAAIERLIGPGGPPVAQGGGGDEPEQVDERRDDFVAVSPSLLTRMNRNRMQDLSIVIETKNGVNCLVKGEFTYIPGKDERGYIDTKLAVDRLCHAENVRVVRINMGSRQQGQSLLGKALQGAAQLHPPEIVTASGNRYQSIGYVRKEGARTAIKIDPSNKIRTASELDLAKVSGTNPLYLFFLVDKGETITSFEIGKGVPVTDSTLNVPVE